MRLMLDTNVLGKVCHPRKHADVRLWFRGVLGFRLHEVFVPEIADYELRRKLMHLESNLSLATLNRLGRDVTYVPLDTPTMHFAAELWAGLRTKGKPNERDEALGADVILAAQALRENAAVVTDNAKHLERMVRTYTWAELR